MPAKSSVPLRQKLLIDWSVQGCLLGRTALYSAACCLYFSVILIFNEWASEPGSTFVDAIFSCLDESIYWAPGLVLLIPMVVYDLLKLTNRFAGPFFRLQREMGRLVNHESESPLGFRDGDYWVDVTDDFNAIREELMQLREFRAQHGQEPRESEIRQSQLFTVDDETASEDPQSVPLATG